MAKQQAGTVKQKVARRVDAKAAAGPKGFRPTAADLQDAPQRARKILAILGRVHPDARCALEHKNALELLIATILSAQCTDERVNLVTKDVFRKYRRAADYAQAPVGELEEAIKSTGFYRNKAKSIKAACRDIVEKFGGRVPDNMEELVKLAGVGRKTANVVLGNAYGIPGVMTDTHVLRLSRLMGLSRQTDPVKLEFELQKLFPRKEWTRASHLLIFHGRRVCGARGPACEDCAVRAYCAYGRRQGEARGGQGLPAKRVRGESKRK